MEWFILVYGLMVAHFIFFFCGMFLVAKTSLATPTEKKRQFWFSMLLPIVGPFITIFIHWSDLVKPVRRNFPTRDQASEYQASDLLYAAYMSDGFGASHTASIGHTDCGHSSSDHCHG
jgi:TRAP-type C4-dicarboxylate transport system permease small subunit